MVTNSTYTRNTIVLQKLVGTLRCDRNSTFTFRRLPFAVFIFVFFFLNEIFKRMLMTLMICIRDGSVVLCALLLIYVYVEGVGNEQIFYA